MKQTGWSVESYLLNEILKKLKLLSQTLYNVSTGSVKSLIAGKNISIDDTDPQFPIISSQQLSSFNMFSHLGNLKQILSAGTWDANIREIGNVVRLSETELVLTYTGTTLPYTEGVSEFIGLATSTDNGLTWVKGGLLGDGKIITTNSEDPYIVIHPNTGEYYLYAERKRTPFNFHKGIELFISDDLVNWTSQGVVLDSIASGWEDQDVSSPTVIIKDNIWYLYYEGRNGAVINAGAIGLATSIDGITFTRQGSSPIIYGTQWNSTSPKVNWATHIVPDDVFFIEDTLYMTTHAFNGSVFACGLFSSKDMINFTDVLDTWVTVSDNDEGLGSGLMVWNDGYTYNAIKNTTTGLYSGQLSYSPFSKSNYTARLTATGLSKLSAGNKNEIIYANITANRTFELAKNYVSNSGVEKTIYNNSVFELSILPDSGVTINGSSSAIVIRSKGILHLVNTGVNTWVAYITDTAHPYLVYRALLTQTGTNAPEATVLENTLGGNVTWTRDSAGVYTALLPIEFDILKGTIDVGFVPGPSLDVNNAAYRFAYFNTAGLLIDRVVLLTGETPGASSDNLLQSGCPTPIEIKVFINN